MATKSEQTPRATDVKVADNDKVRAIAEKVRKRDAELLRRLAR